MEEEVVEKSAVESVEATRKEDEDSRTAAMMQAYGDGLSAGYVGKILSSESTPIRKTWKSWKSQGNWEKSGKIQ